MKRIRSRLGSNRFVRKASWTAGEFVHRKIGDSLGAGRRSGTSDGEGFDGVGDRIRPTHLDASSSTHPFRLRPMESVENPVLTGSAVTDYGDVEYVADPFLFPGDDGTWHLFFEIFNRDLRPTAVIGHATSTDGCRSWTYDRVVLRDEVHLAFPYVFEWNGAFYMIPDRWDRDRPAPVRIFRTESLPDGWRPVATIVQPDRELADCVVFRFGDRWWAVLGSNDGRYDLCLYYSDDLLASNWTSHERNPVVTGRPEAGRPAGRPIVMDGKILLFFQDCAAQYGDKVRAFDVERLSPTAYADRERPESPILEASGRLLGWNSGRMHHIDPWYTPRGWRCAVDGNVGLGRRAFGPGHWAIGMYRA